MIIAAGLIILWVACGLFTTGATVAYYGRKYPTIHSREKYMSDLRFGIGMGLLGGPLSAVIVCVYVDFLAYGWSLRDPLGGADLRRSGL